MKKKNKPDVVVEEVGQIVSKVFLKEIKMTELRWGAKISINEILPRSYRVYKIVLEFDEQPLLDRMDDVESELNDSLFSNEKTSKKEVAKRVAAIRKQLDDTRKLCEKIEFSATVDELKYKNSSTEMVISLPDDVIEPLNRQKERMSIYKITLVPVF